MYASQVTGGAELIYQQSLTSLSLWIFLFSSHLLSLLEMLLLSTYAWQLNVMPTVFVSYIL